MKDELMLKGRNWKKKTPFKGEILSQAEILVKVLDEWFRMYLRRVDSVLVKKIAIEVKNASFQRTRIEDTVFNFTGKSLSKEMLEGLRVGSNYIVHTRRSESQARSKMENELYLYLVQYRKYIERADRIYEESLYPWLEKALKYSEHETEHKEFYSSLLACLAVDMGIGKRINDRKYDFTEFDKIGVVIVEADKGMGICAVNVEELMRADSEMVNELGGMKINETGDALKVKIANKIKDVEGSLDKEGEKFLRTYYGDRMEKLEESEWAFLKLRPKLHKLTKVQLENKEVSQMKYRPVVDASRGPLNSFAKSLMEYLRELIRKVEKFYFPEDSPMIKNGHAIINITEEISKEQEIGAIIFAVADLSSAYTYIYLENLLIAMEYLGSKVGIPQWKIDLFQKIAKIVLENSYIETTDGIFLLNSCLPMGLCCSGECMDLVLLLSELVFMGKIKSECVPGFVAQYGEYKLLKRKDTMRSFLSYKRYRDDTWSALILKKGETLEDPMRTLGGAFIPTLDINIEVTMYVAKFLDVVFYKRFAGTGIETMVKRKACYPIGFCHAKSNMNTSIVDSIVKGEVLRHRRLTKNRKLVEANDESLVIELQSRGYRKEYVEKVIKKRIKNIGEEYDHQFVRRKAREDPEGLVYGSKTVYDEEWNTHHKLHKILKHSLPIKVRYNENLTTNIF